MSTSKWLWVAGLVVAGCAARVDEEASGAGAGGGAAGGTGATATATATATGTGTGGGASSSSGTGGMPDRPWCGYEPDWSAFSGRCGDGCLVAREPDGGTSVLFDPAAVFPGSTFNIPQQLETPVVVVEVERILAGSFGGVVAVPKGGGSPTVIQDYGDEESSWGGAPAYVATNVIVDGDRAYYGSVDLTTPARTWTLLSAPLDGSAPPIALTTLDDVTGGATLQLVDGALVVGAYTGIYRVDTDIGGKTALVTGADVWLVTAGDGYVFYRDGDALRRVDVASGDVQTLGDFGSELPRAIAVDEGSHTLAMLFDGSAVQTSEDGAVLERVDFVAQSPRDAVFDGSRVWFTAQCKQIPDGSIGGAAYVDFTTRVLGWVGEEAGFPFVPHANGADTLWTLDAIYARVVQ